MNREYLIASIILAIFLGVIAIIHLMPQAPDVCDKPILMNSKLDSKISILDYRENHTVRECFDYCRSITFNESFNTNCFSEQGCFGLCK